MYMLRGLTSLFHSFPLISLFLHIDIMNKSAHNPEQAVRGFVFKYSSKCIINASVLPAKNMTNPCASGCYVIKVLCAGTSALYAH